MTSSPRPKTPDHRVPRSTADALVLQAFSRLDKTALGVAVGVLVALGVFGATIALVLKGGRPVGPNLALLGQYFVGYTVTPRGSVLGALYGFLAGFALGWLAALIRNTLVLGYLRVVKFKAQLASVQTFMDDL